MLKAASAVEDQQSDAVMRSVSRGGWVQMLKASHPLRLDRVVLCRASESRGNVRVMSKAATTLRIDKGMLWPAALVAAGSCFDAQRRRGAEDQQRDGVVRRVGPGGARAGAQGRHSA